MKTTALIDELERERKVLTEQLGAIDTTLEGLRAYKALSNGSWTAPKAERGDMPTKTKGRKTPSKVSCPDCGKRYVAGAGLAAHRSAMHGFKAGMSTTEPVPVA